MQTPKEQLQLMCGVVSVLLTRLDVSCQIVSTDDLNLLEGTTLMVEHSQDGRALRVYLEHPKTEERKTQ